MQDPRVVFKDGLLAIQCGQFSRAERRLASALATTSACYRIPVRSPKIPKIPFAELHEPRVNVDFFVAILSALAHAAYKTKTFDLAEDCYLDAGAILTERGTRTQKAGLPFIYHSLAKVYMARGDYCGAKKYLSKAQSLASPFSYETARRQSVERTDRNLRRRNQDQSTLEAGLELYTSVHGGAPEGLVAASATIQASTPVRGLGTSLGKTLGRSRSEGSAPIGTGTAGPQGSLATPRSQSLTMSAAERMQSQTSVYRSYRSYSSFQTPQPPLTPREQQGPSLAREVAVYRKHGTVDLTGAARLYNELSAEITHDMGILRFRQNDLPEAVRFLRSAVRQKANICPGTESLANSLYVLSELQLAFPDFGRVAEECLVNIQCCLEIRSRLRDRVRAENPLLGGAPGAPGATAAMRATASTAGGGTSALRSSLRVSTGTMKVPKSGGTFVGGASLAATALRGTSRSGSSGRTPLGLPGSPAIARKSYYADMKSSGKRTLSQLMTTGYYTYPLDLVSLETRLAEACCLAAKALILVNRGSEGLPYAREAKRLYGNNLGTSSRECRTARALCARCENRVPVGRAPCASSLDPRQRRELVVREAAREAAESARREELFQKLHESAAASVGPRARGSSRTRGKGEARSRTGWDSQTLSNSILEESLTASGAKSAEELGMTRLGVVGYRPGTRRPGSSRRVASANSPLRESLRPRSSGAVDAPSRPISAPRVFDPPAVSAVLLANQKNDQVAELVIDAARQRRRGFSSGAGVSPQRSPRANRARRRSGQQFGFDGDFLHVDRRAATPSLLPVVPAMPVVPDLLPQDLRTGVTMHDAPELVERYGNCTIKPMRR